MGSTLSDWGPAQADGARQARRARRGMAGRLMGSLARTVAPTLDGEREARWARPVPDDVVYVHNMPNFLVFAAVVPKLTGGLTARPAREGEKVLALNEKEYVLAPFMTVIADDAQVHDIGGIMGGEDSGVSQGTTDVMLEVAYFTPENDVQQATTRHGDGPDIRTYYRGGPFWTYKGRAVRRSVYSSHRQRRVVLRRKG